ncbi:acetamidase [Paenibacillus sp. 598K]|uniref:acetamidase/formamidase family protein n=1 Tax=Paenibacillus sp. 598K TaxID=1117987 RepID=UPI000FFAD756|nr:acetamidase/formamidase family protein [Paenibacillus sp. 598K]GBF76747.1 acetamidase [Paenibacillus sp. 598K]
MEAKMTVYVDRFTDGVLDPARPMEYRVKDGGYIIANTAPGCWGPMITPALKGGHEVTRPVYVEGAEPGDAIVIHIESIAVTSMVTASGNDRPVDGRFDGDPFVAAKCPHCGTANPQTVVKGIGPHSIRCAQCDEPVAPFELTHAYTMAFDDKRQLGLTLDKAAAERIAENARHYMATPEHSIQNPILHFAPADMPGTIARVRPFLGQLGTTPARAFPDSHNAGDFGQFLIGAPHSLALTAEQLEDRTDGHMDINRVREGAILLCPVKVEGGGVYLGDMHAMQGDGEIAGHTTDVSGVVKLRVQVIKGLQLEGPILLPLVEDLPYLARPFSEQEKQQAAQMAHQWHIPQVEELLPISFVGTGANLNDATTNGLERAARFFEVTVPEIMNRATVNGAIQIGRNPGVVTVTFLAPLRYLERKQLAELAQSQYR